MRHVAAIETGAATMLVCTEQLVDMSWYSDCFTIEAGVINDVTTASSAMHLRQQIIIDGRLVAEQHVAD